MVDLSVNIPNRTMNVLENISIRTKLLLISLVPLLVLGYFLSEKISEGFAQRNNSLNLQKKFEQIENISALVHELQLERGMAFGFLIAKRTEFEKQLIEQRKQTDQALISLRERYLEEKENSAFFPQLDSISYFRDKGLIYLDFINTVKWNLITEIYQASGSVLSPEIQKGIITHVRLLQAKEYLARIRSDVEGAILAGRFQGNAYANFASLEGKHTHTIDRFLESASPELKSYFDIKTGPSHNNAKAHSMIQEIFDDANAISQISEEEWWTNTSYAIEIYKEVEDQSIKLLQQAVRKELDESNRTVIFSAGGGVLLTVVLAALVLVTIRQIAGSINKIKDAAEKISQGEIDFSVEEKGADEITALARSFNQMIAVTKQYIQIADTIGKGDYTPDIRTRSDGDVLSRALINMKNNLLKLSIENENRTWLLTGNSQVNDSIQGDKALPDLTYDILRTTISHLQGLVGTLFIKDNGTLELNANYALDNPAAEKNIVRVGEGLVGQAARDGKVLALKSIPKDYMPINSSLGKTSPKSVVIFPFHYEGEVKGVMEIGLLREINSLDLQFLETISNNISLAIQASQSRERLKELLEETQRQSEELVSQQEELTIANEELQQKTEMLERSEEELRAQQEELQQTNEELYSKASILEMQKRDIEDAKIQLEEKAQELERTNRYKSEFLANMSHELRTPLNSILILSQVLIENRNNRLTPKEIQFANTIYNSGSDLMDLINEVLDLSKIEAGKMELDIETFGLQDIAKNLEQSFTELAKQKSIRYHVEIDEALYSCNITSDIQRVEQVLKNFLSNAFKFTDEGGKVTLSIQRPPAGNQFQNAQLNGKPVVCFTVSDTGIGIPPEKLAPIFEAFEQVDGSTKRKYGGTGLGLSISKELANLLGGEIHVESNVAQGSSFSLCLPEEYIGPAPDRTPSVKIAIPIVGQATDHSPSVESDKLNNPGAASITETDRKILILEPDSEFANMLMDLVHERKYKSIHARHGVIGLNYVRYYKPDAIILNMDLPGMSGVEILRHLKKDPQLRHIPVQIISRENDKNPLVEGAFDVIPKPVSKEEFGNVFGRIENFLDRKLKRLLIVEDDEIQNEAIRELIGNGDVKCYSAFSGQQAFDMLLRENFDCIIVDLGLPDMTGFDLLEKIKANHQINRIPVIVYTGKSLTKEENTRLEKLSSTIVMKTAFSPERLLDETTLFLHRVESGLPKEKQVIIRKLHKTDQILRNKKVLIVDDDVRNVYSLVAAFEQEGLSCVTAENGKIAIQKLKDHPDISIAMMDIMMPEMDGFEATKEIRKMKEYADLPIIALTAKAMKGDREKCLAAGMSDYVSKPINIQQLLSLMRVWLYD